VKYGSLLLSKVRADGSEICHFFHNNSSPISIATELEVAFAIVTGLHERLVQWDAAYLPGWMAPDVADAWWCCPHLLHSQPPFQLTTVGQRISRWEPHTLTTVRWLLTPVVDVVGYLALLWHCLQVSTFIFFARGTPHWTEVQ
jgi:hypothetical protein